jgi:hypothetical protein
MKEPRWQGFEKVIAEIHRKLAPGAVVRHNHRVLGQCGRRRQLDVTITHKIGPYPVFIVIECRLYKRRVAIDKVEAFAKKLQDVRGNVGVMISRHGFDQGASAIAARENVLLFTHREAQEADWSKVLGPTAWVSITVPRHQTHAVHLQVDQGHEVLGAPDWELVDELGQSIGTVQSQFDEVLWPNIARERRYGPITSTLHVAPRMVQLARGETMVPVETITIIGEAWPEAHVINLTLGGGQVLESPDGKPVYSSFVSEGFDWREMVARTPGQRMSLEEYERIVATPGHQVVDISNAKKFLRLDIEARNELA